MIERIRHPSDDSMTKTRTYLSMSKVALQGRLYVYSWRLFKYVYFNNTIFDEMLWTERLASCWKLMSVFNRWQPPSCIKYFHSIKVQVNIVVHVKHSVICLTNWWYKMRTDGRQTEDKGWPHKKRLLRVRYEVFVILTTLKYQG